VKRLTGDYPGAAHDLEEALDLSRRMGARGNEAWAMNHYAGRVHAERAQAQFRQPTNQPAIATPGIEDAGTLLGAGQRSPRRHPSTTWSRP